MQRHLPRWVQKSLLVVVLAVVAFSTTNSNAIPAFSRMYGTSCSTCHIDFPKLNDFGKAFKDAGFKFPKDDESMLKIPPVMLGAPANAELWPKAIWPGTIPGIPPIGLRYNNYFQYTGTSSRNFNALAPVGTVLTFVPTTDFETGLFSIFTAGNFGSDIAFWADDDISVSGANGNGGLGDAYLKFVNVSRLLHMPKDSLNLRVGQFELELPFTQARSIWLSPYDIYSQANIGVINPAISGQQFINNQFTMADVGKGIEFSGGHHTGGYQYSIAFVDQNTSGVGQDANTGSPYVPQALGSNNGGLGVASDANFKDIYANFNYRFNLEKDKESRNAIQAAGPMGPRDHTYLNFGTYYFYGRSVQYLPGATTSGVATTVAAREPFYRVGGNFTFNFRCCFQINGLYMYGHDYNLLPVDATGIPIAVSGAAPVGFVHGSPSTFSGGFVDAEWLAYPWMYVMIRYDGVNSQADYHNALVPGGFTGSSFNGAYSATRNRITPALQFLIHANIKASFEYEFRPSQSVEYAVNPVTGLPMAINAFHTNTLVLGLEYVY